MFFYETSVIAKCMLVHRSQSRKMSNKLPYKKYHFRDTLPFGLVALGYKWRLCVRRRCLSTVHKYPLRVFSWTKTFRHFVWSKKNLVLQNGGPCHQVKGELDINFVWIITFSTNFSPSLFNPKAMTVPLGISLYHGSVAWAHDLSTRIKTGTCYQRSSGSIRYNDIIG